MKIQELNILSPIFLRFFGTLIRKRTYATEKVIRERMQVPLAISSIFLSTKIFSMKYNATMAITEIAKNM
jgi:hypothetical protein